MSSCARAHARLAFLAGVATTMLACGGGGDDPTATCTVTALAISPPTADIEIGATVTLIGSLSQANCSSAPTISWSSSSIGIATVSPAGVVTGVSAGSATISAVAGGRTASATVTVRPAAVASVQVTSTVTTVVAGETIQLTAVARDAANNTLAGRALSWSSNNEAVATVGATTGLVTGVSPGTATVTVTSEARAASVVIQVTPAPVATVTVSPATASLNVNATQQLTATLRDSRGNALTRPVTWTSSANGIASVSTAGLVTAVAPGQATITATAEGKSGTTTITVTQVSVATVTLTLSSAQLSVGQNTLATATVRDAGGTVLTGRQVTFTSSAQAVATVASTGPGTATITAVSSGTATITASIDGVSATQVVTVTAPVATVTLNVTNPSIPVGGSVEFAATAKDAGGQVIPGKVASWSVTPAGVITLNQNGDAVGIAVGVATVTATIDGISASTTVTVTPAGAAVASVTLSQASASLQVGGQVTIVATPRDAQGNALARPVTWSSSNESLVSVNSSGLVTGLAVGTATVTATSEGKSASATITVGAVPVAAIQAFTIPNTEGGTSRQITVVPLDANGFPLGNRVCTWSSSLPAVASVTSPGMTTTLSVVASLATTTLVTITVTCESATRNVQFTATPIPVATVIVIHDSTHLAIGENGLARVELRDAQNQVINGRQVRWSVSNMLRATVPPGSAWTLCANEGGTCAFTGTRIVRYGTGSAFFYRELTGGTPCNNGVFGDPAVGFPKQCSFADLATTTSGTGGLDVTGVGAGAVTLTATPVVNPNGVSGNASVTIVPAFTVTTAETVPAGAPASIETTDVLTFSNPINLATFTIANVYLQVSGGAKVSPTTTGNAAPNVYSYYVLHNEATNYQFVYTSGLKDIYGKALKNPGQIAYTTVEMDPQYYYRISSQWLDGLGRSLSIDPVTFRCIAALTNTNDQQQRWYTNPDPGGPTHWQLQNQFYGAARSLESDAGPTAATPCHMDPSANVSGQYWFSAAFPQAGTGYFRLHSEFQGLGKALDQDGGSPYTPYMAPVGLFSGQAIHFTRIARRP